MKYYLGIDIGASSGRHIIGYYKDNILITDEVYRFKNELKILDNHMVWDVEYLFNEVKLGIKKALENYKNIESLSIDTWGVDYVLLKEDKEIFPVYGYRDSRTSKVINDVHNIISFNKLYSITGSQFQPFNTIYQLYYDKVNGRLDDVTDFLYIPEYLIYKLTGKKTNELTMASTSGMLDVNKKKYSNEIINKLGFNEKLFKELLQPGTLVGSFTDEIVNEVGGNINVVLCATHDTASAVCGINMDSNNPYISSGTWSLLGVKLEEGINNEFALKANYSNELGPNYVRFQKNIMGLWIIQCISKETNLSFEEMIDICKDCSYTNIYNVNDDCFLMNDNMCEEIKKWFRKNYIEEPKTIDEIINSTFHSLAYSYKKSLDELEIITGKKYNKIYIVGGGAKNDYLNALTMKYTNKEVVALKIEATALGNLLVQMENDYDK